MSCNTQPIAILLSSNTVSIIVKQVIKKSILLAYFHDSGCVFRDLVLFLFLNLASDKHPAAFKSSGYQSS